MFVGQEVPELGKYRLTTASSRSYDHDEEICLRWFCGPVCWREREAKEKQLNSLGGARFAHLDKKKYMLSLNISQRDSAGMQEEEKIP